MSFSDLIRAADTTVSSTFVTTDSTNAPLSLTVHYNVGMPDGVIVNPVVKNPSLEEDYVPGSPQGSTLLILFLPSSNTVPITHGNTATYGGVDYDVSEAVADRMGGITVKMRKRSARFDQ